MIVRPLPALSAVPHPTSETTASCVHVLLEPGRAGLRFDHAFRIGRGEECEVRVASSVVSREHAEVAFEAGAWWVRDLGSTNGVYLDGRRVERARLGAEATLRLGHGAPTLHLRVEGVPGEALPPSAPPASGTAATQRGPLPAARPAADPLSMSGVVRRYFESDEPAGTHTRLIRNAYATVRRRQKRRYAWIIGAVAALGLVALVYAVVQQTQNARLRAEAAAVHDELKQQDLEIARLQQVVEETENASLEALLANARARRARTASAYDGLIEAFGLYRRLDDDERRIYSMARIFNESQFSIPASFVHAVERTIEDYWLTPAGRGRFERAVRRAEEAGYTPLIVDRLRAYGLPAEFFYLALQESNLDPNALGPLTRWGRAKGMWQFIPSTARRYGLDVGERADLALVDPQDERHDVERATDAAARYLLYIYSTPAQASGLLVMASYNWGEHRVIDRLKDMPDSETAIEAVFEGIAETPDDRNYWRFLEQYSDRMPDETKDYVLKIFAAAVIGQDPRHYGFAFDNPLLPYLEGPPPAIGAAAGITADR